MATVLQFKCDFYLWKVNSTDEFVKNITFSVFLNSYRITVNPSLLNARYTRRRQEIWPPTPHYPNQRDNTPDLLHVYHIQEKSDLGNDSFCGRLFARRIMRRLDPRLKVSVSVT